MISRILNLFRRRPNIDVYPTLAELGLKVGDDVIWECTDTDWIDARRKISSEDTVTQRGRITNDTSAYATQFGERFVELDNGYNVSTLYLRKA